MNRIIKAAFLGVLSFVLITAGICVPLLSYFYVSGQERLGELRRQVENRGVELSIALARLATEQWGPKGMVSVSSAMEKVVQSTGPRGTRTDEYLVKEIYIVDREGQIRAHNDFTKLASEAQMKFDQEIQSKTLALTERNPAMPMKSEARFETRPFYLPLFQKLFPAQIHNHYVFGAAVFSLDGPIHWGGLHLIVEVKSVERVMAEIMDDLTLNVLIALALSLAISAIIVALALLMGGGAVESAAGARQSAVQGGQVPAYEGLEPYEDQSVDYEGFDSDYERTEEEHDPYADEEIAGGRILDAIPLERTRRDRTPAGY